MEPHGQSPWYLHEIPSYANLPAEHVLWQAGASEGFPPVAKSAEALILRRMNDPIKAYTFIHKQSPCLHAEVPTFAETFRPRVSARRRGLLRRRINLS
jgi:hypothetical protein